MDSDGFPFVVRDTTAGQSRLGVRTKVGMNETVLASRTLGCQNVSGKGQGTGFSGAFIVCRWEVNGTCLVG
jgi:hypothetical protein